MKIRSITYFCNPGWPLDVAALDEAGAFIQVARTSLQAAGYEVQTTRLATIPFPELLQLEAGSDAEQVRMLVIQFTRTLEAAANAQGFDYVSLGPASPDITESYQVVPEMLAASQNVFASGMLITPQGGISLPAVRFCAEVIHRAATITPDGFTNLRFAALANVPPGAPFFPAAYHQGSEPTFALATEAANLAVEAITRSSDLDSARQRLVASIQSHADRLTRVAREVESQTGSAFGGIDFSLAPFPEVALSIGTAFEQLGVPVVGLPGSLAAAAFLTDALDRARFLRAGFNGLFLPVLEDFTLAKRAAEGLIGVNELLLYSAVCGTGLDTVPLPGDTPLEVLEALLLDLAALALRLGKPLTARLMPVPGKVAGDLTEFDFPYFANSRVLAIDARPLERHFQGVGVFSLQSRSPIKEVGS